MKRNLLTTLFLLIYFASNAQFTKGKMHIGIEYYSNFLLPESKNSKGAWSSIYTFPSFGYNFRENIILGANLSLQIPPKSIRLIADVGGITFLSPFVRIYKHKNSSKILPFIQLSPKIGKRIGVPPLILTNTKGEEIGRNKYVDIFFGGQANLGTSFMIHPKLFIDFSFYVDKVFSKNKQVFTSPTKNTVTYGKSDYSDIGATFGLKILL